jgi:hypothetical protein
MIPISKVARPKASVGVTPMNRLTVVVIPPKAKRKIPTDK